MILSVQSIFMLMSIMLIGMSAHAQHASVNPLLFGDSALAALRWDVQPVGRGSIMYLDVPFARGDSSSVLTLTVAKDRTIERPTVISVMLPEPVDEKKGLVLAFSAKVQRPDGSSVFRLDSTTRTFVPYQDCNSEFCTARMKDAYSTGRPGVAKADVYADLMKYDHLMIVYSDSSGLQRVLVPLAAFHEQYKKLE